MFHRADCGFSGAWASTAPSAEIEKGGAVFQGQLSCYLSKPQTSVHGNHIAQRLAGYLFIDVGEVLDLVKLSTVYEQGMSNP